MRKRFGNWGAGLSEADFACALAAFGILAFDVRRLSWTAGRVTAAIRGRFQLGPSAMWRFDERNLRLDARVLAQAWHAFRRSRAGTIRIYVEPDALLRAGLDPEWVKAQLSRSSVGATVETFEAPRPATRSTGYGELSYGVLGAEPTTSPGGAIKFQRFRSRYTSMEGSGLLTRHRKNLIRRDLSRKRAAARPVEAQVEPRKKAAPRYLQAQLHSLAGPIQGALRPGKPYTAAIRVGLPDAAWKRVAKPFPAPEEPPEPKGHRLTVIFWEPRVCPEPEVKTLWLPREGNSDPVELSFEAPGDVESIAARVTVLHANRVLQTGLLKAPVGTKGKWTFGLDATPRTRLEGLAARTSFDAALVLNHDAKGTSQVTVATDGKAVVLPFDDENIRRLTELLGELISAIADDPERYEGIESPGSLELLRSLAQVGAAVHDHFLKRRPGLKSLDQARRIHITSARTGSFLPAELFYRFRPPAKTARLCPHAVKALKTGDCSTDCPSDKRKTVCPLGFWGLSKVIERHAYHPDDPDSEGFALRREPTGKQNLLAISGASLLAASGKASLFRNDAVTRLHGRLKKRGTAALATTWEEWEKHVRKDRPRLLVLLPHHDRDERGLEFLEIGEDDRIGTAEIWHEMVRRLPNGPYPVVLLMGCETNLTRISFDNPVSRFQDHGAAVVVSTIATILGRHASPATGALVQLLDRMADGKHTFGDVMLRLRQKLVATSTPMALGLTSYGDADWVLTREKP